MEIEAHREYRDAVNRHPEIQNSPSFYEIPRDEQIVRSQRIMNYIATH